MEQLTVLEKANRRQDRERAQALLAQEKRRRISAENRAAEIRKEAAHWVDLKRRLPEVLAQMDRDYQTIHGFDFGAATAAVQKAAADWPEKKPDLDNRLAALKASGNEAESLWQSTRRQRTTWPASTSQRSGQCPIRCAPVRRICRRRRLRSRR
jgi:hypothetical protein